jgi:hypothetical protein
MEHTRSGGIYPSGLGLKEKLKLFYNPLNLLFTVLWYIRRVEYWGKIFGDHWRCSK